jgi:hypothetical protein
MFTSPLRRIFDVRLFSLTAVALLSACAIHRPDALPDAAPTPSADAPALPHIELPEFDIPVPEITVPDLVNTEPATPPITHWVTNAPSFVLVTTSELANDEATSALLPTFANFVTLFGERPSRIAVAVIDTSNGRPFVDIPEPPAGVTSIVMVASGLTGSDSAATAEALSSELRFEAATAWIFDYAAAWRESLGLPGVQPLPDWMHLALLHLLTEPNSAVSDVHPTADGKTMSLDALFAHRVSEREADAVLSVVRGPAGMVEALAATPTGAEEWQRGMAFTNESTRLLVFLRETMGDSALANIVGATAAGMPMSEILRRLPLPMTTEELNVAFQAWSDAQLAVSNRSRR